MRIEQMRLMEYRQRKALKIAICVAAISLILILINFIPTFYLKNPGMNELRGEYITVYYEKEEAAAEDVYKLIEGESMRVALKLGFTSSQDICLYIYDNQRSMQIKKYGLVVLFMGLDWYIGDNRGTSVILTSPANPGNAHDYDEVKTAAVHETVHAYNSLLNPNMPLWVNEGMATYLAGQTPREVLWPILFEPSIVQMHTNSPTEFEEIGGYEFAYTYIEFIDNTFGWENVLIYAKTNMEWRTGSVRDSRYTAPPLTSTCCVVCRPSGSSIANFTT
jgi:hypothetical protein